MRNPIAVLLLAVPALVFADSPSERVLAAVEDGALTGMEAARYLVASVVDPSSLPSEYTVGTGTGRCGTPAIVEAYQIAATAGIGDGGLDLLARPVLSGPEYIIDSDSGHFKIHWTNTGVDATTEAYAQGVADQADWSWAVEVDDLGFYAPPSDLGLGGDSRYDMYVYHQSSLGYTSPDGIPDPSTPRNDMASHIAISPGMGLGLCQVTVAHEFQHACQMGTDVSEPSWFMENCATWVEDIVYPDVNDYWGYLHSGDNPLRKPWFDIREGGTTLYWYAGCIWPRYMQFRLNADVVREIWYNCGLVVGNNMLPAQEDMFEAHGMTWDQAFMEYACWRWFTASNWFSGCGMYDDEAVQWYPGPFVFPYHNITTLPASGDEGTYPPDTYGIHWIKVNLANYQGGWVNMHFDGRDAFEWRLGAILWDTAGNFEYCYYDCDGSGVKDVAVPTSGWDYAIFIPALFQDTSLDKWYDFTITYSTGVEGGDPLPEAVELTLPVNPASTGAAVTFSLPVSGDARLDLFDVSGRLVETLYQGQTDAGTHSVSIARDLPGGNYLVRLCADGQIVGRRLTIIE